VEINIDRTNNSNNIDRISSNNVVDRVNSNNEGGITNTLDIE